MCQYYVSMYEDNYIIDFDEWIHLTLDERRGLLTFCMLRHFTII